MRRRLLDRLFTAIVAGAALSAVGVLLVVVGLVVARGASAISWTEPAS